MNDDILHVWIYPQAAKVPVLCGTLELLRGRQCIFSYADSWLGHAKAFPLAPDMLLREGAINPSLGLELHPIFEDAGPDRWGKNIINKVFNPRRRSPLEYLERAGEDRIGALGFARSADNYEVLHEQTFQVTDLPDLVRAAHALSIHAPIDEDLQRLLRPGASAGGARPKAVIRDQHDAWIAKFPTPDDDVDECAIEHASLRLAASCGITVPESRLIEIGGRNVLLVKRFDREPAGRLHLASARTMLIAAGVAEDAMGYGDLADATRRVSAAPKQTCEELFRRMAVNVLIDNTDDHAKNHAFLYQDGIWHLSPAYDLQPQRQGIGYQQLKIGKHGHEPNINNILSDSSRFLLKAEAAREILGEITQQLAKWPALFQREGVSQRDIDACAPHIMNARRFDFGKAPERFSLPKDRDNYIGSVVAINEQHVYQDVGQRRYVQHDRNAFAPLPLPEQFIALRYHDNEIQVMPDTRTKRGGRSD